MKRPLRVALAGAVMLILAVVGWSLGGPPSDAAERRAAIEGRTESQRDQLRRRYEIFQRLDKSDQAEIRRLHQAVEADPSLAATLDKYEAFVARLDPWDQEELRQISDPAKRLEKVKAFASARSRRDGPWRPSWMSGRFVEGTVFPPAQFEEALTLLAGSLELTETQRKELDAIAEPHRRHLRLLQFAAAKFRVRPANWPDAETATAILSLLPEGRSRTWLLGDRPVDFRIVAVPAYLTRSLLAEWQVLVPDVVGRDELRKALERINERDQAEWAREDPNRLQREIVEELVKQEGPIGEFAREFDQVAKLHFEFDPFSNRRFGRPPGSPDRGGPGGPDGRRGPGDGMRDPDRRPGPSPRRFDLPPGSRDNRGD